METPLYGSAEWVENHMARARELAIESANCIAHRPTMGNSLDDHAALLAVAIAADAYLIAEAEEADAASEAAPMFEVFNDGSAKSAHAQAKQRLNIAYTRLFEATRRLQFPCMCFTEGGEWRPCPTELCERPDHFTPAARPEGAS